ncbi:MAG: thiamine biosynthesis protein ThiS [Aeromicrobium sp.]|jgi:sulfur carrier protein|nr:thiamine biosynthesis protein ThiS [Aeromicrobium sp.]MCW2823286.1 thiamine biosynthesis protein ThiS [Aeromicrobium sp.]
MHVTVNGQPREVPDGARLPSLVADARGVAAAVNGVVVRGSDWPSTVLREDDRIEVVTARQGG